MPGDTRERIQAAARLGYVPNRFAQALKTSRTMMLACIVPDIANPFYPALIRGIQSTAEGHGYDVIALNTDGDPSRERHLLDWSQQGRVDGVVGVFWTLRAPDFADVLRAGVPVVHIESTRKRSGELPLDDIFVVSEAASLARTRFLLGRGHARVAATAGHGGLQGRPCRGLPRRPGRGGPRPGRPARRRLHRGGARAPRLTFRLIERGST